MKTRQHIFLICLMLMTVNGRLIAQQGNVAAGGDGTGTGGSMSFSIGQTDYLHVNTETGSLHFGLQQPWYSGVLPFLHNVSFPAGWSSLSSYLMPSAPAPEDVFAPMADELIIAQTMTGYYQPGENTNTIGNWPQHAAFTIKTSEPSTLPISGMVEANRTVSLVAGWNLLPVLSAVDVGVAELFAPVGNQLIIVKDVAGTGVYWPGQAINTIGMLIPGRAYFVKVNEAITVEFPQ